MIIGSGITFQSGITFIGDPSAIGSTASTVTPSTSGTVATVASSPFGSGNSYQITYKSSTPYSFLSTPGNSGFAFGTGNYTIEWFQYQTDNNSFPRIFWYGSVSTATYGVSIEGGTFYYWPGNSPTALISAANIGTYKNVWVHFAIVRINSRLYVYKDGVLKSTFGGVVNSTNHTDTSSTFYIGSRAGGGLASEQYGGNIQSFRVVKGVGVYTGDFTRPTSPLGQTQSANPYGGSNTSAITAGQCSLLLNA